jgi:transposase InsO family protein
MRRPRSPFSLAVSILAGFLNRCQQDAIDYLREENRVLREMLGGRRLRLTDAQRKRLAIRGKALGRALLKGIATLIEPDTILDWHRRLVAKKWTYASGAHGNAEAMKSITKHVVRMARENLTWGYDKIQGALKNLGHIVCPNTIKAVLRRNGITPAPDRGRRTPWKTFLKAHARSIFAADFFATEVWAMRGLVTHYTLIVIHHATRAVRIVGTTVHSGELFMDQIAQLLTDPLDGFLRHARFLIIDLDSIFTASFQSVLKEAGIRILLSPASAPNCNALAEMSTKSIEDECFDRMIPLGTDSLLRALREYELHYRHDRAHQAVGNGIIEPEPGAGATVGAVARRERLGGLLSDYDRRAA